MSNMHLFNPDRESWKMYTKELTSISGDDLKVIPYDGKDLILEVSGNNEIIFKKGDLSYNLAYLSNVETATVTNSTANTNFPVIFHNGSNGLLDDTGTFTYNPSSGNLITTTVATTSSITSGSSFIIGSADLNETDLEKLDGITNGTVIANKCVVVDNNKDISSFRNITGKRITFY